MFLFYYDLSAFEQQSRFRVLYIFSGNKVSPLPLPKSESVSSATL